MILLKQKCLLPFSLIIYSTYRESLHYCMNIKIPLLHSWSNNNGIDHCCDACSSFFLYTHTPYIQKKMTTLKFTIYINQPSSLHIQFENSVEIIYSAISNNLHWFFYIYWISLLPCLYMQVRITITGLINLSSTDKSVHKIWSN